MNPGRFIFIAVILIVAIFWLLLETNKSTDRYKYGNSFTQNQIVNTIRLHNYGITGERITIGLLDAGFNSHHPIFENTKVLKEFDFVLDKLSTFDSNHIGGVDHGTHAFSVVGGYEINQLIGIAFGSNYILARSDISAKKLAEEESLAIEASRWLADNRVDIISTSLSYKKFENADYYYPSQMNGLNSNLTKTADSLFNEGILYIASSGNSYENDWKIIEPPSDGFNVLAVGSVNNKKEHSFFSSIGPSADGRIKPDIVTPGESVWNANASPRKPLFSWGHGTSLSAPIAAGIAALVLSTHPDLSPAQVNKAIKETSSNSDSPDTIVGWGIPDAEKASSYFGPIFSNSPHLSLTKNTLVIGTYVFSSFDIDKSSIEVFFKTMETPYKKFTMSEEKENYYEVSIDFNGDDNLFHIYFIAKDKKNQTTKYPCGRFGEYFTAIINEDELKMIN